MGAVATTDRPRPGAAVRERLVDDLNALCDRLGCAPYADHHDDRFADWPQIEMPTDEDERLMLGLRTALARLADPDRQVPADAGELTDGLDGAELMSRAEILMGQAEALRALLPGFAYLVVLAASGPSEAVRVSDRAARLLNGID